MKRHISLLTSELRRFIDSLHHSESWPCAELCVALVCVSATRTGGIVKGTNLICFVVIWKLQLNLAGNPPEFRSLCRKIKEFLEKVKRMGDVFLRKCWLKKLRAFAFFRFYARGKICYEYCSFRVSKPNIFYQSVGYFLFPTQHFGWNWISMFVDLCYLLM